MLFCARECVFRCARDCDIDPYRVLYPASIPRHFAPSLSPSPYLGSLQSYYSQFVRCHGHEMSLCELFGFSTSVGGMHGNGGGFFMLSSESSAGLKSAISSRSLTRGCQFRIDRNLTDLTAPRGTAYAWWGRGSAARGRKKGS